jgi:hypothetical protein
MRYICAIVLLLFSILIGSSSYGNQKIASQPAGQIKTVKTDRIILVENPYPEQVQITYLCVYLYKNPWKGICEKVTNKHPGFFLRHGEKLSDIQRIGLVGKNLQQPNTMSECLVHFDHSNDTLKRLENSSSYIAQVNYVAGNDMVCQLLKESDFQPAENDQPQTKAWKMDGDKDSKKQQKTNQNKGEKK